MENAKKRIIDGDEIANLRQHFDLAICTYSQRHESREVECQNYSVAKVRNDSHWFDPLYIGSRKWRFLRTCVVLSWRHLIVRCFHPVIREATPWLNLR